MPDIHVNIGLSRRPDNRGNATAGDKTSLQAVQKLFVKPVRLGLDDTDYNVRIRVIDLPRGDVANEAVKLRSEFDVSDAFKANLANDMSGVDLLYIPGAPVAPTTQATNRHGMAATQGFKLTEALSRDAFEARLIEAAMARGIPILAVCAGSWRLIECLGGQVRELSEAEVGTHHGNGWNTNHGLSVDSADTSPGLVTSAAKGKTNLKGANSTHWSVADAGLGTDSTAFVKRGTKLTRASDTFNPSALVKPVVREPNTGTVEAFESQNGAPIVGTQWHPESFLPDGKGNKERYKNGDTIAFSREIFRLMVLAAITSRQRRGSLIPALNARLLNRRQMVEQTPGAVSKNF